MAETDRAVTEGECLHSIAEHSGFYWETLWNHPKNAEVKKKRGDPDSIQPGDVIHIPSLRQKTCACPTEKVHRFRKKGPGKCLGLEADAEAAGPPLFEVEDASEGPDIFDSESFIDEPDIFEAEVSFQAPVIQQDQGLAGTGSGVEETSE